MNSPELLIINIHVVHTFCQSLIDVIQKHHFAKKNNSPTIKYVFILI